MTKKHSTKKALMASVLSLLLCFSMLIGTTFAWFTDSVTSANNIIKSGNLDVELYYQAEGQTDWTKVTNTTNVFKENALWEPGHTEVVKLKVVNEGSLALKYNLGVNVASEVGSVNVNNEEFKLSDFIKFGIVDGAQSYTRDQAIAAAEANGATALKTAYNSGTTALEAKNDGNTDEKIVTMVVYMPTTVGNEANFKKGATVPTIHLGINLMATQITAESDSFDNQYDANAMTYVKDTAEAQAALDAAVPGTVIKLLSGASYGTLLLRPVDGNANTTTSLNEADGEGLTLYRNEYIRKVENLTIIGAPGATVDAIKVESGYIVGSGSSCNLVDVKGLVIDSVEFTDKADCAPQTYSAPIFFNLTWTDVDGLTVNNCKLIGNDDKVNFVYFTIDGSSAFDGVASNVTLTGNTVDGIARLCELRQTKNVTITDNVIKNTVLHGILLPVHNGVYAGNVTITGNTAVGINERFVRMSGAGDAAVVIKDNVVNNYFGEDVDYIKVTDGNNVTVENNTIVYGWNGVIPTAKPDSLVVDTATKLISINDAYAFAYLNTLLNDGNFTANYGAKWQYTVELNVDVDLGNKAWTPIRLSDVIGFNGNGHTIKNLNVVVNGDGAGLFGAISCDDIGSITIENFTIDGATVSGKEYVGVAAGGAVGTLKNIKVVDATVNGTKYVGGLAGRGTNFIDCSVKDSTVTAIGKTVGGLVGYAIYDNSDSAAVGTETGNLVENVTVTGAYNVGGMFGQAQNVEVEGNTVKNVTVISTQALPANASSNEVRTAAVAARSAFANTTIGTNTVDNVSCGIEVYGLTLIPNGENSKIIVNDKEGFLNITKLFADWTALFTDGNGNDHNNYVNGAGVDYYYADRWTISLEADIDLNNATIAPVTIQLPLATGSITFNGNNHTIKNAKIVADAAAENMTGLFKVSHEAFKNLKLDNIHVTGSNVGNSSAGILAGSCHGRIDNITITNSSVTGGKYTGGVVGYGYTDISNCTLTNVAVKGGYKLGGIIGYICASNGTGDVTGNTLTDCTVDGIGGGVFAGGKTEYVIGQVVGNYDCNGTCNNNTITGMTSSATAAIGKIEAGKTVNQ